MPRPSGSSLRVPKQALQWLASDLSEVKKAHIKQSRITSGASKREIVILVNRNALLHARQVHTNIPAYIVSKNFQFYREGYKRGDRRIWVYAPDVID